MKETLSDLNDEDRAKLDAMRAWVRDHYPPEAREEFDTVRGKLSVIHAILTNKWVEATERVKLQSLGVALGDAFVQQLGFTWKIIEEAGHREIGLNLEGTSLILWPITMISQRIEAGEDVNIARLFQPICELVAEVRDRGQAGID